MASKGFKIKWAEGSPEDCTCEDCVKDARDAAKVAQQLHKLLKKDNMVMSHTDEAGFIVYLPGPAKVRTRRRSPRKHRTSAPSPALVDALHDLVRWAAGNGIDERGKAGNPYCHVEVKNAMKVLAELQGKEDWLDVDTSRRAQ